MKHTYLECEWDEHNLYKNEIKHGVTDLEIEECFENKSWITKHKQHKDRRLMLGITNSDRYLYIVFQHISKTIARPISARDMQSNERSLYERQTGRQK